MCTKFSEPFHYKQIKFFDRFATAIFPWNNNYLYKLFFIYLIFLSNFIYLNNTAKIEWTTERASVVYLKIHAALGKRFFGLRTRLRYRVCAILPVTNPLIGAIFLPRARIRPYETMTKEWCKVTIGKFQVKMFPDSGIVSWDAINSWRIQRRLDLPP